MPEDHRVDKRLDAIEKIVLHGNGNKSLIERVGIVETTVNAMEKGLKAQDHRLEAHDKKLDRLFWLVAIGIGMMLMAQFLAPMVSDKLRSAVDGQLQSESAAVSRVQTATAR